MARVPSLGGVTGFPADAIAALRKLPEIIEGLRASADTLHGAVQPLGRLAGRVPGQKKG